MDPDGDYESRHSTRSAADDVNLAGDDIDVESPSKIFVPDEDTKLPAKPTKSGDAYKGATAPPMEGPPLVADAAAAARSSIEPRGTVYDDMMTGKMDLAAPDEAPISNSVAVPIGFDSDDMALPEAKALPLISSTANNEATKMPLSTLEEVRVEDTEAQVEAENHTPVPVPFSSDEDQSFTGPDATSDEEDINTDEGVKETPTMRNYTRRRKLCCCSIITLCAVLGTVLGVLYGTTQGQLFIKGVPNCNLHDGDWWPSDIGNGHCSYWLNTAECGWDGGDCLVDGYPDCHEYKIGIGNGYCNPNFNTVECGWDGGDCVELNELHEKYPKCDVELPNKIIPSLIGNGVCDEIYGTAECGWDDGDCLVDGYPDCHVDNPNKIGNSICDEGDYNTAECGWDGGDCLVGSEDEQSTPDPTQEPSTVGALAPVTCSDFSCMNLSTITGFYQQDILLTEEKIFSDLQVLIFEDLYQWYTPFYGPGEGLVDPDDPSSSIISKCEMTGQSLLGTSSAYKSLWTLRVIFQITWSSRTIIVDNYANDFRNFINANITVVAEDMFESGLMTVERVETVRWWRWWSSR